MTEVEVGPRYETCGDREAEIAERNRPAAEAEKAAIHEELGL